jgi:hypothetical protein
MSSPPGDRMLKESPIFPAAAVFALPIIIQLLPDRFQIVPRGFPFIGGVALAIPMLAAGFAPTNRSWARAERITAAIVLPLAILDELVTLAYLLRDMARFMRG